MSDFVQLATLSAIPENGIYVVEYEGQPIALYNLAGEIYATSNICSHSYAELSEGYLDTDDCTIECPLHGSRFDIRTGAALNLPAFAPIASYPERIEGDAVLVAVSEE